MSTEGVRSTRAGDRKVEAGGLKMAMAESSFSNQMLTRISAAFAALAKIDPESRSLSTVMPEMCEIKIFRVIMFAIAMARSCADKLAFASLIVFVLTYKLE